MSGIQVMGLPELPVEGVRLENIRLTSNGGGTKKDADIVPKELGTGYPEPRKLGTLPAYGIYARHVRNLEFANVRVGFEQDDARPAIACVDVDGLEFDSIKAQVASGVSVVKFEGVKGLSVRNSPLLEAQKSQP